jgi:hypothetical protein
MGWGAVKEWISNGFGLIRQPIRRKEMTKGRQRGEGKGGRRKGNEKRGDGEKEWGWGGGGNEKCITDAYIK